MGRLGCSDSDMGVRAVRRGPDPGASLSGSNSHMDKHLCAVSLRPWRRDLLFLTKPMTSLPSHLTA